MAQTKTATTPLGSLNLSDKHISDLQLVYKNHLGKEISKEEAREQGLRLLRLMELIYKPMTQEEQRRVEERVAKLASAERSKEA